jgi:hypothetical protein
VFVLNALFLTMYVSVVGDWMFGLRFFVPVLPLVAVFTAEAVDRVSMRSVWVGRLGAAVAIVWMLLVASSFSDEYRRVERRENFLTAPTLDPGAFFKPYWAVYTQLRDKVPAGTVIADNQAGFVPFMLDAENIDDLGICSRFYAELPTRDVFFTEVGRFMPLTNHDARSAGSRTSSTAVRPSSSSAKTCCVRRTISRFRRTCWAGRTNCGLKTRFAMRPYTRRRRATCRPTAATVVSIWRMLPTSHISRA